MHDVLVKVNWAVLFQWTIILILTTQGIMTIDDAPDNNEFDEDDQMNTLPGFLKRRQKRATEDEKNMILDGHNSKRGMQGASNMEYMVTGFGFIFDIFTNSNKNRTSIFNIYTRNWTYKYCFSILGFQ